MLSGFANLPSSLDTVLAGAQSGLNNYLNAGSSGSPLGNLPIVGSQLGNLSQVKNALDNSNLEQAIQNAITSSSPSTGPALQLALYAALGPNGAQILGGDGWNNNTTDANSITYTAVHISGFGASAPLTGTVEMRLHEAIPSGQNVSLATLIPNLPIQFSSVSNVALSGSIDVELEIQITNGSVTGLPQAPLNHYSPYAANVPGPAQAVLPTQAQQQSQMMVSVTATVNGGDTAYVGFLQGNAALGTANSNTLTAAVYVASLTSPSLAAQPFGGSAYLDLNTTLSVPNQSSYPSVTTEIAMNWTNLSDVSTLTVSFNQLSLHLNGFFTTYVEPILADVAQYTQPIISVYSVLNSTVPGISSLPGLSDFTVLEALEAAGLVTQTEAAELNSIGQFATQVQTLISDTAGVSTGGNITFGSYTFNGSALAGLPNVTTVLSNLVNQIPQGALSGLPIGNLSQYLNSASSSDLQNIENNPAAWLQQYAENNPGLLGNALNVTNAIAASGLIQFPVMDDPASLLGLLFGDNVNLVTVNTGQLNLPIDLNVSFNIPVYGLFSIGAGFTFNGSFTAEIEAGYDTQGIRDYFANGSNNTNDLLDGLYIQGHNGADPGTNVTCNITAQATFGGSISVVIASASIDLTGGITATVSVGTNPARYAAGNKIYVYSSGSLGKLTDDFSLAGQINTSVDLTATLQFLLWSQTWTIANLDPVLWDPSLFTAVGPQQPPPTIYAFSDSQGPMTGGSTMTVYGLNLEGASQVNLTLDTGANVGGGGGGNIPLGSFPTFNDKSTSFQFTIPQCDSTYPYSQLLVSVQTPGGTTGSNNQLGQDYIYVPAPSITRIVPLVGSGGATGGAGGGTLVNIQGAGLGYVNAADFGSVAGVIFNPPPSSPYYNNGTYSPQPGSIYVYSPPGTGTVNVKLVSPGGTVVDPGAFTYVPQPQITGIDPAFGAVNASGSAAETITITGQNFGYLDGSGNPVPTATGVLFGYTPPAKANNIAPLVTQPVLSDTFVPAINGLRSAHWVITVKATDFSAAGGCGRARGNYADWVSSAHRGPHPPGTRQLVFPDFASDAVIGG